MGLALQVALIITTYNRPDALRLVLESVAKQSRKPDQVIICDDGSDYSTRTIIRSWATRLSLYHVWCPDVNFRAALSRNLGILKTTADLLVFVDGDCLLPPPFIKNHLNLARGGCIVSGGRHLLSEDKTIAILNEDIGLSSAFDSWKFSSIPAGLFRDFSPENWELVRSCNLSVYREDVIRIGGFDESYVGWGREDSDFVVRLIHSGIKIRSGRLATCVSHLYHAESPRDKLSANEQRFRRTLNNPNHVMATSSIIFS